MTRREWIGIGVLASIIAIGAVIFNRPPAEKPSMLPPLKDLPDPTPRPETPPPVATPTEPRSIASGLQKFETPEPSPFKFPTDWDSSDRTLFYGIAAKVSNSEPEIVELVDDSIRHIEMNTSEKMTRISFLSRILLMIADADDDKTFPRDKKGKYKLEGFTMAIIYGKQTGLMK